MTAGRNKTVLMILFSFALGGYFGYVFFSGSFAVSRSPQDVARIEVLEKELEKLNGDINFLQKKMAQIRIVESSQEKISNDKLPVVVKSSEISSTNSSLNSNEHDKAVTQLAIYKAEKFSKWMIDQHTKSSSFNLGQEMKARFEAEKVDSGWAETEEKKLGSMFGENPEFAGVALKATRCRVTQCEISISIADVDQANRIGEMFSKVVATDYSYNNVIAAPDPKNNTITFYISRNEHGFELD